MVDTSNWTVADVAKLLDELGMSKYKQSFIDNDIDGKVLPYLNDDYFRELGVSIGHRVTLKKFINSIKPQHDDFTQFSNAAKKVDSDQIRPLSQSLHYQLFEKEHSDVHQDTIQCQLCGVKIPICFYQAHQKQCQEIFNSCKNEFSRRKLNIPDDQIVDLMNGKVPENHINLCKCSICGRKFSKSTIAKHEEFCKKHKEEVDKKKKEMDSFKKENKVDNNYLDEHKKLQDFIKEKKKSANKNPCFPIIDIKGVQVE